MLTFSIHIRSFGRVPVSISCLYVIPFHSKTFSHSGIFSLDKEIMYSVQFICLFVCAAANKITQKLEPTFHNTCWESAALVTGKEHYIHRALKYEPID